MGRLARWIAAVRQLSLAELATALRMAAVALAVPLLERTLSLPAMVRALDCRGRGVAVGDPERQVELARRVLGQDLGPLRPGCYRRSLVLFHVLRRCGHRVRILFGVTEHAGALAGHSWLEADGRPLAETGDPHEVFQVVFSYPPLEGSP